MAAARIRLPGTRGNRFTRTPMSSLLRYWIPLIVWMFVIFSASADTESSQRTSRFLEPFLRWLNPNISAEAIDVVRFIIRKAAHMIEYAILAWLWWRALRRRASKEWSWKVAGWAWCLSVVYAITDEAHQLFVANRTGSPLDVLIDAAGATLALGTIYYVRQHRSGRQLSSR